MMHHEMISDSYGRQFKKLRVSLLNTCNFACTYCVPEDSFMLDKKHIQYWNMDDVHESGTPLSFQELTGVINDLHHELELKEIHLTGGEPLLYPRIIRLVTFIRSLGIQSVKLTTNGFYLHQFGHKLLDAGVTGLNVSLDAMDSSVFRRITKRNHLNKVLEGIDTVLNTDVNLKLNAVIMRNINDNQIIPLFEYARKKNVVLRYIELMNMGYLYHSAENYFYAAGEILDTLSTTFNFTETGRPPAGTARYWRTQDGYQFGIIANESFPFCRDCDRLRLDSQGKLYGCITARKGIDVKGKGGITSYRSLLKKAMAQKQPVKFMGNEMSMLHLGG